MHVYLCQGYDGRNEPAHTLPDQVGVEVDVPVEAHVGEEQDRAGAVYQGQQEHKHKQDRRPLHTGDL